MTDPTTATPKAAAVGWVSTLTPLAVAGQLKRARHAVVLTHARPDGDAIGTSLALTRAMLHAGIPATSWFVPPVPRWTAQIAGATPFRLHDPSRDQTLGHSADPEPDVVIIVDTGSWTQLDEVAPWLRSRTGKAVVIDHHLTGDPDVSESRLLDTAAAAAAEVVAPVCQRLLGAGDPSRLPLDVAEPLYLGLGTDTGWFRFSNTRPETLRLAAALREAGVDAPRLFQTVEQQDRPARLRLLARALASLELHAGDTIAVMCVTQKDFLECHGDSEDTTGFASDVLSVRSLQVGVLLTEVARHDGKPPIIKASLRSKPGERPVDVAALTRSLGGGGHARAAGVKLQMTMAEAKAALLAALGA